MVTDEELLRRWADGDNKAGDALVRRHFAAIHAFFRNKLDGEVDDLIQRTFLALSRHHTTFRGESSFRGWLFKIARNELLMHFRRHSRKEGKHVPIGERSVSALGVSGTSVVAAKRERKLLLQALREIPLDLQIALELHYWEGLSTGELAEVLEIPQGTVKSRLRRGRAQLEEALQRVAESPELARTTVEGLEDWARSVRACVAGD